MKKKPSTPLSSPLTRTPSSRQKMTRGSDYQPSYPHSITSYHFCQAFYATLSNFIKNPFFFIFSQNFSNHPSFASLPTHSSSPRNSYIQLLASTNGHACKRTLCHKPNIDTHTPTHFACHYAHFVTQPPSQPKSPLQLSSLLYSFFNPPPISYHTPSSFVKQWGDKKIDENYVMG